MTFDIENTTIALQHYYDVKQRRRKHALAYVHTAIEQPFGAECELWVLAPLREMGFSKSVNERLDALFLGSRNLRSTVCARVLDVGNLSEQGHFIVTEALEGISLREHLRLHGALKSWQVLCIVEQLASLAIEAQSHGLRSLAISTDNIFLSSLERARIKTGPIGLGLLRSEILNATAAMPSSEISRTIPPWEYSSANTSSATCQADDVNDELDSTSDAASKGEEAESLRDSETGKSMQDLETEALVEEQSSPYCSDFYTIACVAYEGLSALHPYFMADNELSDAVLTMREEKPSTLFELGACDEALSSVVMDAILRPKKGGIAEFVSKFRAAVPEADRENADRASRLFEEAPKVSSARKQKRIRSRSTVTAMQILTLCFIALVLVIVSVMLARYRKPIDLFALPEIIPYSQASDACDVVLVMREGSAIQNEAPRVFIAATDGELLYLGHLPYILKGQSPGAQLNFVISNAEGYSRQLPVLVESNANHLMVVEVLP
ncbi:MAG: hypothetical protein WC966_08095 [Bradymonadales bacterium]|jgi:serine/threonine protein kinase